MITCQNCGKINSAHTNFCRFCGTKITVQQPQTEEPYTYAPPRPYAWKTDEFAAENNERPTQAIENPQQKPLPFNSARTTLAHGQPPPHFGSQIAQSSNYAVDQSYHCPRCGSSYLPVIERRISTAGWVVFSCLLVFTFIFFWIGLLMKEDVAICPACRARVG